MIAPKWHERLLSASIGNVPNQ
jgi:transposase-like protein